MDEETEEGTEKILGELKFVSTILALGNSWLNPCLYVTLNSNFRTELLDGFRQFIGRAQVKKFVTSKSKGFKHLFQQIIGLKILYVQMHAGKKPTTNCVKIFIIKCI